MQALILIIHVLVATSIVVLVLLQHGKGADVGATFGSGSSQTMFGSAGSMSFFMKLTAALAAVFFATSLALSYIASHQEKAPLALLTSPPAPTKNIEPAPVSNENSQQTSIPAPGN